MHPFLLRSCLGLQAVFAVAAIVGLVLGRDDIGSSGSRRFVVFCVGEVLLVAGPALALMWGRNQSKGSATGVTAVLGWKGFGLLALALRHTGTAQSSVLVVTTTGIVCVTAAAVGGAVMWTPLHANTPSHTGTIRLARRFASYHVATVVPQIAAVSASSDSVGSRVWSLVLLDIGLFLVLAAGIAEALVAHTSLPASPRLSPTRTKLLVAFGVVSVCTKGFLTGFLRLMPVHENPFLYWTAVGSVTWFYVLFTAGVAFAAFRSAQARTYLRSLFTAVVDDPVLSPTNPRTDMGPVVLVLLPTAIHWLLFVSVPGGVLFSMLHPELYVRTPNPDDPASTPPTSPCYWVDYQQLVAVYLCGSFSLLLLCAARIMEAGTGVSVLRYTLWFLASSAFTAASLVLHAFGLYGLVMSSHCNNPLFRLAVSSHSLFVFTWLVLCLVYMVVWVHRDTRRHTDVFWEAFAARSVYFSQACVRSLAKNFGRICVCLCLTSPVIGMLSYIGVALTARRLSGESIKDSLSNEDDRDNVKSMMWMVSACFVSVYSVLGSTALAISTRFHRPRRVLLYAHLAVTLGGQFALLPYEWSLWRDHDTAPQAPHEHTRLLLFRLAVTIRVFLFCNLVMLVGLILFSLVGGGRQTITLFMAALKDATTFANQIRKLETAMRTILIATSVYSITTALREMEGVLQDEPALRHRLDRHKAALLFETKQRRHPNLYTWSVAAAALQMLRRVYGGVQ